MKRHIKHWGIIAVLILMMATGLLSARSYFLPKVEGSVYHETQWFYESGNGDKGAVTLPYGFEYQGSEWYRLTSTLSFDADETEDIYAFAVLNHSYVKAYVDDKEIYSYTEEDTAGYSKSPGNVYAKIPIPAGSMGKTFTLELYPMLGDSIIYETENVEFADYPSYMTKLFWMDLPQNLLVIMGLIAGMVIIVLSLTAFREVPRKMWYMGVFAVLFCIYALSENRFDLYMISNPFIAYLMNFIAFAAFPIPLIMIYKEVTDKRFGKIFNVQVAAGIANIVIQTVLHFAHIFDLREMLPVTHILDISGMLLLIVSLAAAKKKGTEGQKVAFASLIPIAVGMVLDLCIHYFVIDYAQSNTFFTQLGVLIFVAIGVRECVKAVLKTCDENLKNNVYKELAYSDGLTGLKNRAAYNVEIDNINAGKDRKRNIICLCADINNLKKMNDRLGHEAGDAAIYRSGQYLVRYFDSHGHLFRVGGDEFNGILFDISIQQAESLAERMRADMERDSRNIDEDPIPLTIAVGFDKLINGENVEECFKRADKKMYIDKNISKKKL